MLPWPIFNIELLTSARRTRFYWIRVVYAGVLPLTLCSEYPGKFGAPHALAVGQMANFAAAFFLDFSIIQILAVLLIGPAVVARVIGAAVVAGVVRAAVMTGVVGLAVVAGVVGPRGAGGDGVVA